MLCFWNIFKNNKAADEKSPEYFADISPTKAYFRKYLKEKFWLKPSLQLPTPLEIFCGFMLSFQDIFKNNTAADEKRPAYFADISPTKAYFRKYLKEKFSLKPSLQLPLKYFVDSCFVSEEFSKMIKLQTTLSSSSLGMNGLRKICLSYSIKHNWAVHKPIIRN